MKATKLPSGNYRCRVWDNKLKKQVSFTADSSKEAKRLAAVYDFEQSEECPLTFEEAMKEHMATHKNVWKVRTYRTYEGYEQHYKDILKLPLKDLDRATLQKWTNKFAVGHSPKTVKNVLSFIKEVRSAYIPEETILTDTPKLIQPELKLPSEATVEATARAVEGTPACVPFYLAAYGAMRRGEVAALRMDHIDFKAKTIYIDSTLSYAGNKVWVVEPPKTPKSIRRISVPDIVFTKIKKYGLPDLNPDDIYDEFCKALKDGGIPHYRYHDLRHFCAARMLAKGIPIAVVQEYGGWSDERTLLRIYNYVIDEVRKQSMEVWNDYVKESFKGKTITKSKKAEESAKRIRKKKKLDTKLDTKEKEA